MSQSVKLLTIEETLAAAEAVRRAPDKDLRRAITGMSMTAIASLAVLAHQLDAIARASAAAHTGHPDLDRYAELRELLLAAGYLAPLATPATQEADRGQG